MPKTDQLTIKQERYATAIVEGATSQTRAAEIAGYGKADLARAGHVASRDIKVQRAIERKRAARMDAATAIKEMAAREVQKYLILANDPQYALASYVAASKITNEQGEIIDPIADHHSHLRFKLWIGRIIQASLKCGMDRPEKAASILLRYSNLEGSTGG